MKRKTIFGIFGIGCVIFGLVYFAICCLLTADAKEELPDFRSVKRGKIGWADNEKNRKESVASLYEKFCVPPSGYGEVPFYWFTGDKLTKERLSWQLDFLSGRKLPGVAADKLPTDYPLPRVQGIQINAAHAKGSIDGKPYGMFGSSYPLDPPLFTPEFWNLWAWLVEESNQRGIGIGISDYTLAWPGQGFFVDEVIADPARSGKILKMKKTQIVISDINKFTFGEVDNCTQNEIVKSYNKVKDKKDTYNRYVFYWETKNNSIDPMDEQAGKLIADRFFGEAERRVPEKFRESLNYFFQDELVLGVAGLIWTPRFAEEFQKRKGYDIRLHLPHLFEQIDDTTPKIRLDYHDVKVALSEEGYFKPVASWHSERGMLYGCDQDGRGLNPMQYGDYFRTIRWFSAPGHDTPGSGADIIKGKVSSSISHLYGSPRVWLEGYHSAGWGMTLENLTRTTNENYAVGCNLLCLHGLYYTTHGGFWEWAPPCYHFRMPYWQHAGVWLQYFERLSFILTQGNHVADVAIVYPVEQGAAGYDVNHSTKIAFDLGRNIYRKGIDFDFIDGQSLARSVVENKTLNVSGESYKVLILPAMQALRWDAIKKIQEFHKNGGIVIAIECLPEASDRVGANDPELKKILQEIFTDGKGYVVKENIDVTVQKIIADNIVRDFEVDGGAWVLHRRIETADGNAEIYFVQHAAKDSQAVFRANGDVQLWNAWNGTAATLTDKELLADGRTRVRLPLDQHEGRLIAFLPNKKTDAKIPVYAEAVLKSEKLNTQAQQRGAVVQGRSLSPIPAPVYQHYTKDANPRTIDGNWESELVPTMDNTFGDFRLPVKKNPFDGSFLLGAEARKFKVPFPRMYCATILPNRETEITEHPDIIFADPNFDDKKERNVTYGFGTHMSIYNTDKKNVAAEIEIKLMGRNFVQGGGDIKHTGSRFSWRWGVEGDPGDQRGYHGLKERVSDDFLVVPEGISYFRTTIFLDKTSDVFVEKCNGEAAGTVAPTFVWIDEEEVGESVKLKEGYHRVVIKYEKAGRSHVVLSTTREIDSLNRTPLAMKWFDRKTILRYSSTNTFNQRQWFRFITPPGLTEIAMNPIGDGTLFVHGKEIQSFKNPNGELVHIKIPQELQYKKAATVAIRMTNVPHGYNDGGVFTEPIFLNCGKGLIELGDWSKQGVLETYSGGIRYRKTIDFDEDELKQLKATNGRYILELGQVSASCEVRVNGSLAAVLTTSPWRCDITKLVVPNDNVIEILVMSTLANHYQTIPSQYRGNPKAGLIGTVQLLKESPTSSTESQK